MEKNLKDLFNSFGIDLSLVEKTYETEKEIQKQFENIELNSLTNQAKVLKAFQEMKVSTMHFNKTTGYGYDDVGRKIIEKIYSKIFNSEDSLVRVQFVNGTHAIATALKAILMPGDEMLAISGQPYDTLCEVIGIVDSPLSLKSYGVKYSQIDLLEDGNFDMAKITEYLKENNPKLIHIQRSKGYALRKSLYISDIEEVITKIKEIRPDTIIMVDNCYGEFVETKEPTDVGADLVCGSLIKNIGGGLCETGAYIVGRKNLIKLCAETLTCPGIGKECGATMDQNRNILQGLFVAPSVVKNALKAAVFASRLLEKLGYDVYPKYNEKRGDIIQAIKFNDESKLISFIQGIQSASPIDSNVVPTPWEMPRIYR